MVVTEPDCSISGAATEAAAAFFGFGSFWHAAETMTDVDAEMTTAAA